jgi:hypothetical protein
MKAHQAQEKAFLATKFKPLICKETISPRKPIPLKEAAFLIL